MRVDVDDICTSCDSLTLNHAVESHDACFAVCMRGNPLREMNCGIEMVTVRFHVPR
jgi:hypothetical protein